MTVVRAADLNLTPDDIEAAGDLFGIDTLKPLGGFENLLFKSDPQGQVIRLTHTSRRSPELIEGEFEFIDHLARLGVPAVEPIRSQSGHLVEEFEANSGDHLLVVCMKEAPGERRRSSTLSESEIVAYGELLGSMHVASQGFKPTHGSRLDWNDPIWDEGDESDPELLARTMEVKKEAEAHWAGGLDLLIHQDAHLGNIHVTDQGSFSVFDFDDCAYGTPTHDIGIVLFYWLFGFDGDMASEARRFLRPFLQGYERHARLPSEWPDGVDHFLAQREGDIYWLLKTEPPDDLWDVEVAYLKGRRQRILSGAPFLGQPLARTLA